MLHALMAMVSLLVIFGSLYQIAQDMLRYVLRGQHQLPLPQPQPVRPKPRRAGRFTTPVAVERLSRPRQSLAA